MCHVIQTPSRRLHSIPEIIAAGLIVTEEDRILRWTDPDGTERSSRAEDNECLCGVDTYAIADRSGIPWRVDLGDVILEAEPPTPAGEGETNHA